MTRNYVKWYRTAERLPNIRSPWNTKPGPYDADIADGVLCYAGGRLYLGYPCGPGDSWHIRGEGLADPPEWWTAVTTPPQPMPPPRTNIKRIPQR